MTQKDNLWMDINSILADIKSTSGHVKAASEDPKTDTSHPTKSVEDGDRPATEGAQTSFNTNYVKENFPSPVDSADSSAPKQEELHNQIGTTKSTTGNDSSVEKDFKDRKDDPGTSSPMEIGSEKYGKMTFDELHSTWSRLANEKMAVIAARRHNDIKQLSGAPAESAPQTEKTATSQEDAFEQVKIAAMQQIYSTAHSVVEQAVRDAVDVMAMIKKAEEEESSEKKEESSSDGGESTEASEPSAPPAESPVSPEAGLPVDAGGGVSDQEAMQELMAVLAEMGLTPEMLLQMLAGQGGGGDPAAAMGGMGGGDPAAAMGGMGGGEPPMAPPAPMPGMEPKMASVNTPLGALRQLAKSASVHQRKSGYLYKPAAKGSRQHEIRNHLKRAIWDILNNQELGVR